METCHQSSATTTQWLENLGEHKEVHLMKLVLWELNVSLSLGKAGIGMTALPPSLLVPTSIALPLHTPRCVLLMEI